MGRQRLTPDPALCDAAGTTHAPASGEARIVSLVPSITELLFDLGAGSRVVGRTPFCIHPHDGVANVPRVGGTKTPRLDRIRALEPTHVILNVDENRREDADALAAFVPDVIVTHPLGPRDNPALYRLVGGIFASREATERLCRAFERAVSALESAARHFPQRRVLYLIWRDPWMTVSPDTYVSRTLALVNFVTTDGGDRNDRGLRYPELALTAELLGRVDLVLLSSEPFPFKERHISEIRARAGARPPRHPALRRRDGVVVRVARDPGHGLSRAFRSGARRHRRRTSPRAHRGGFRRPRTAFSSPTSIRPRPRCVAAANPVTVPLPPGRRCRTFGEARRSCRRGLPNAKRTRA